MSGAIDDDAYQQFCGIFSGDGEAVQEILEIYLQESAELGASVQRALAAGDLPELRRAAHSLKSTSRQVGAVRLGDMCGRIEEASKDDDLAAAEGAAEGFDELLEASRSGLQARV